MMNFCTSFIVSKSIMQPQSVNLWYLMLNAKHCRKAMHIIIFDYIFPAVVKTMKITSLSAYHYASGGLGAIFGFKKTFFVFQG